MESKSKSAKAYCNGKQFEMNVLTALKRKYFKKDGWSIFTETQLKSLNDDVIYPKKLKLSCQTFDFLCFNAKTKKRIFIYCQTDLFGGGSQITRASIYLSRDFILRKRIIANKDKYLCLVERKHNFTRKSKYASLFKFAEKDGIFKTLSEFKANF